MLLRIALLALAWAFAAPALAQTVPVPPLAARVTDLSGTLSAAERAALEQKLAAFEQHKGSQIAVLLVPTTGDETIEQYGIRVVEAWKLGRDGVDDGALLLVAKDDKRMRIEVGYGLEGVLPDAIAKRIVAEQIAPYFRQGDWYTGISAGVDAMITAVDGEALPPPVRKRAAVQPDTFGRLVPLVMVGVVLGMLVRMFAGKPVGMGVSALAAGLPALLILGVGAALIAALIASVFVSGALGGGRRGGVFLGGGGFGGRGGFGGGGGFSGGGGGFGGGGASGSW